MIFASRPKQTDDTAKPAPPPAAEQADEAPRFADTPAAAPPDPPSFVPPAHFASTPSYGRVTQPVPSAPPQAAPPPTPQAAPAAGDPFASYAPPPPPPAPEQPGIDLGAAAAPATVPSATATMLLSILLDEVADVASEGEAVGFLGALGKRVARKYPLGSPANLIEMETQANRVLGLLGWGRTRMLTGPAGIRVIHQDWPSALPGDDGGHWAEAFPVLLGAVYQNWFAALGAPDDLVTSIAQQSRKAIEYRHGKAEA